MCLTYGQDLDEKYKTWWNIERFVRYSNKDTGNIDAFSFFPRTIAYYLCSILDTHNLPLSASSFLFLLWLIESLFGKALLCPRAQSICCPLCVRSICSAPMFDLKDLLFSQYVHRQKPEEGNRQNSVRLLNKSNLDAAYFNLLNNFK